MGKHASYVIVKQDDEVLVIRDTGNWTRQFTVTNDAEWVVKQLYDSGALGDRKLLYYDSDHDGQPDELKHDGQGNFIDFGPGPR